MSIPLEQGLRPKAKQVEHVDTHSMSIPLEQGLRQNDTVSLGGSLQFYEHSIRTRIKTSVISGIPDVLNIL